MSLEIGRRVGSFEVVGLLGKGGMGEVWRARDVRLERDVALKVLPASLAEDPERLRRFEREARALAALQHPNIGAIFGLEREGDLDFLCLELVPGEDLAERLERGPLPVRDALRVAKQIAEGLEAAHDAGLVHRDLKPANVRLTPDGDVKILDFGIAKAMRSDPSHTDVDASDESVMLTEDGRILGTPTYMSPEQARGVRVDRRTDAWAFGCVLYECLTGRRAFEGGTVADVLAAIVNREPDASRLPSDVPARVVDLIRRSLAKEPRQRLQHLGDARLELEQALAEESYAASSTSLGTVAAPESPGRTSPRAAPAGSRGGRTAFPWLVLLVLAAGMGAGALLVSSLGPGKEASTAGAGGVRGAGRVHAAISVPPHPPDMFPRISPDGTMVVISAPIEPDDTASEGDVAEGDRRDRRALFVRRLDSTQFTRLPATETDNAITMCFSPDSKSIAVVIASPKGVEDLRFVRVDLDQNPPRATPLGSYAPDCNLSSSFAWTDEDEFVTTGNRMRLLVRAVDGTAWNERPLEGTELSAGYTPDVFDALPGGRHVLALGYTYDEDRFLPRVLAIEVPTGKMTNIQDDAGHSAWSPTGHLLFSRSDRLYAVEFDLATLRTEGAPRFLMDGMRTEDSWKSAWFDLANDGSLVYLPGGVLGGDRRLATLSRDGTVTPWSDERLPFDGPICVATDGSFFIATMVASGGLLELWGSEVDAPLLRPLVAESGIDIVSGLIDIENGWLYWSRSPGRPDSIWRAPLTALEASELVYEAEDAETSLVLYDTFAGGSKLLTSLGKRDGHRLARIDVSDEGRGDVRELDDIRPQLWTVRVSRNGEWIAYTDRVRGQRTPVLRRMREDGSLGPTLPVPMARSTAAGKVVFGRGEAGAESLIVSTFDDRILEIPFEPGDPPKFGKPTLLADFDDRLLDFESLPDGRILLVLHGDSEQDIDRVGLVLDAFSMLETKSASNEADANR